MICVARQSCHVTYVSLYSVSNIKYFNMHSERQKQYVTAVGVSGRVWVGFNIPINTVAYRPRSFRTFQPITITWTLKKTSWAVPCTSGGKGRQPMTTPNTVSGISGYTGTLNITGDLWQNENQNVDSRCLDPTPETAFLGSLVITCAP